MDVLGLLQKHGTITVSDLPVKQGPKYGARGFDDDAEEIIYLFVKQQKNAPELAAVHCRTSKQTIYAACQRVESRLNEIAGSSHEGARLDTTEAEAPAAASADSTPARKAS